MLLIGAIFLFGNVLSLPCRHVPESVFKLSKTKQTFAEAQKICERWKGNLASVRNKAENDQLDEAFSQVNS